MKSQDFPRNRPMKQPRGTKKSFPGEKNSFRGRVKMCNSQNCDAGLGKRGQGNPLFKEKLLPLDLSIQKFNSRVPLKIRRGEGKH